jgi:16S rRNA (adenine1518-N6/adenine1519-N6)-dimethyltransferase
VRYNRSVPKSRRPKFGQHFLTDLRYRRRIVAALDLHSSDVVVEIGAGGGAMTELLAERARQVVAIELDPALAENLSQKLASEQISILQGDILSTDLAALCRRERTEKCFVFGNLPYYITSPIIHRLFDFRIYIRGMALLVQREVAARLTAVPGTRAYGYLSVLAQLYSRPRTLFSVPPGAFLPPPKVYSALVDFQMGPKFPHWSSKDQQDYLKFVKRCFAQKRKNLLNNLAGIYTRARVERELTALSLPSTARAEQLTVEQLASLHRRLG